MSSINPKLTFWYEIASPYAFLAAIKIIRLHHENKLSGINIELKPINLITLFQGLGMKEVSILNQSNKRTYLKRDLIRQAKKLDLDMHFQKQFPLPSVKAANLSKYIIDNFSLEIQLKYLECIYLAAFVNNQPIDEDATLKTILDNIGLQAESDIILNGINTDAQWKQKVDENTQQALDLHMFGAPSFTINDNEDFFWGQDRLEDAIETALNSKVVSQ